MKELNFLEVGVMCFFSLVFLSCDQEEVLKDITNCRQFGLFNLENTIFADSLIFEGGIFVCNNEPQTNQGYAEGKAIVYKKTESLLDIHITSNDGYLDTFFQLKYKCSGIDVVGDSSSNSLFLYTLDDFDRGFLGPIVPPLEVSEVSFRTHNLAYEKCDNVPNKHSYFQGICFIE